MIPVPSLDDENHVLLSSLDETVIQHGAEFNLGLHKYQGENYSPKGHKYILSFEWDKVPTTIYRIGGVVLKKEIVFHTDIHRLFIRYTPAGSPLAHNVTPEAVPRLPERTAVDPRERRGQQELRRGGERHQDEPLRRLSGPVHAAEPPRQVRLRRPDWYRGLDYPKERAAWLRLVGGPAGAWLL